jgi:hypothetical protein
MSMPKNGKEAEAMETLWLWALAILAALAWVRFAEHPTARNLRAAIADTLSL